MGDKMTGILILQAVYVGAGALFNFVSLTRERRGLPRLSPTNPIAGMRAMVIAACLIASFFVVPAWVFALAWLAFAVRLIVRSVFPHFRALKTGNNIENYSSTVSAALAFGINLYGAMLGLFAGVAAMT